VTSHSAAGVAEQREATGGEADASIPWRVAIVQRTLPHYRLGTFERILAASAPGSTLIHGRVRSTRQPKQNAYLAPVKFPRLALGCVSIPLRFGEQLVYPVFMPALVHRLRGLSPDIIICEGESNLLNNFGTVRYARRAGIPYVWWGLGAIPGGRPSGLRRIFQQTLRRMIAGAGGVACYSHTGRDHYVVQGARPDTCRVVPNVLDDQSSVAGIARYAGEAAARRASLGVEAGDLVLLTVGSLEAPKRIALALEALALLRCSTSRRIHYWIVGDGPDRAHLEALTASMGLSDVRFWGARYDDVSLYFLMADLFVLPGLGGLALNQAMTHGLPVVCGPADGTERDLLAGGDVGRLLDRVTPELLAEAIAELSRMDLRAMGQAAQQRIATGFTLQHQLRAMADLINMVMARRT
jgi:glycosyltransferase involved in cell wall biosynthesis